MPRLRQIRPEYDAVGRLLRGYGVTGKSLSDALGCAAATARKKLSEPKRFTLGDLSTASAKFGIPLDEIRSAMVK